MAFIDSTPLAVCDNHRIATHKVFEGLAARGKTSMGWFYGFKLHRIVNDEGELLACRGTPGNVGPPTGSATRYRLGRAALGGSRIHLASLA
jgi:hypothetical protein